MGMFRFMFENLFFVDCTEKFQNVPLNMSTNRDPYMMHALSVLPVHYHI